MPSPKDFLRATIALFLLLSVGAGQVAATSPSAESGSKVWIGHYAEYEEFLRNAVVDRTVKGLQPGVQVTHLFGRQFVEAAAFEVSCGHQGLKA